ncbi:MAG: hypothetical protein A2V59_05615 [Armatimonadetes bacterium RBG_19FT_COMBO_69_19]|nr:MAG: hypothetical protein A2V59_05615 [Armatimonadetes bacterium RBG_19FT_COMBO_69_19]
MQRVPEGTSQHADLLEHLRTAEYRSVGANQTVKAIQRGRARLVFVATDADRRVVQDVVAAGRDRGLEVIEAGSMKELGRACGIAVGAAAAAVLAPPDAAAS